MLQYHECNGSFVPRGEGGRKRKHRSRRTEQKHTQSSQNHQRPWHLILQQKNNMLGLLTYWWYLNLEMCCVLYISSLVVGASTADSSYFVCTSRLRQRSDFTNDTRESAPSPADILDGFFMARYRAPWCHDTYCCTTSRTSQKT